MSMEHINSIGKLPQNTDISTDIQNNEPEKSWDADSIFTSIDTDNNGVISKEEAEKFGFSYLKNDNLTKAQFKEQFDAQQKKLAQNDTSLKDFENCFDKAEGGVIKDIQLTPSQQKELLKRIEMFEVYKSTLSAEELTELEKNKHAQLDFAIFTDDGPIPDDYDYATLSPTFSEEEINKIKERNNRKSLRDPNARQYKEYFGAGGKYEKITESLKTGKLSTISNEDLGFILNYTDTSDLLQDGKIGSFTQGQTGDCWFLSQLNNYASTKEGAENIEQRIRNNNDGTYSVCFQNPFNQTETIKYNVSDEELKNFDLSILGKDYSAGDKDVRIYEIATSKLLSEYLPDTEENKKYCIGSGTTVKRMLVHKALGYESDLIIYSKGETLTNSFVNPCPEKDCTADMYEFNADDEIYSCEFILTKDENGKAVAKALEPKKTQFNSFCDLVKGLKLNTSEIVCNTRPDGFRSKQIDKSKFGWFMYDNIVSKFFPDKTIEKTRRYIQVGHVYNLESINDGTIKLNDPYLSSFPHAISAQEFEEHYGSMVNLPNEKIIHPQD